MIDLIFHTQEVAAVGIGAIKLQHPDVLVA
jgi:hypothetical protein